MKKRLYIIILTGLISIQPVSTQAQLKIDDSTFSTIISVGVITSPVWLPVMGSQSGIEWSEENSTDSSTNAKEIPVKDQNGEDQVLRIPEEIADKVDIKAGDTVELQSDKNGVLLLKNRQPAYYFLPESQSHQLKRNKLE